MGTILALAAAPVRGELLSAAPVDQPGFLLLRNGEVIQGRITRIGERYHVALGDGEIRISTADVECVSRTLEEGYRCKRAVIRPGSVQDHLELARWCQRHGLLGLAAGELADAMRADPRHPMIAVLCRRLQTQTSRPPQPSTVAEPTTPRLSNAELDRIVSSVPAGCVEQFTHTIQPLLVNNCTAGGCHGHGSPSAFSLLRLPSGRPPSLRLTQRNLHAVLEWVDREDPQSSRLLRAAAAPHDTARDPAPRDQQAEQQRQRATGSLFRMDPKEGSPKATRSPLSLLADWVASLAEQPPQQVPAGVEVPGDPPVAAMSVQAAGFEFPAPATPSDVEPAVAAEPAAKAESDETGSDESPSGVQRGAKIPRFVPADPFDPQIFNRRFFGTAAGESSAAD